MALRLLAALAALTLTAPASPAAQEASPVVGPWGRAVPRIVVTRRPDDVPAPRIDAVLDDAAWSLAAPLGDLVEV